MAGARAEAYSALVDDTEDFDHQPSSSNNASATGLHRNVFFHINQTFTFSIHQISDFPKI